MSQPSGRSVYDAVEEVKAAVIANGSGGGGALGQAAMAASAPVVIASNQSAIPVSQPGLSGGIDHGVVTLTTANTAYAITPPAGCARITIRNVSSDGIAVVFLGNSDVTANYAAATGSVPLAPDLVTTRRCGESQTLPIGAAHVPYAISATAAAVVAWFAEIAA